MDRNVQGRRIGGAGLAEIRELFSAHPEWSHSQASVALCERWDWRDGSSRLKDIAARSLLRKLSGEGLIRLPALHRAGRGNRRRRASDGVGLEVDGSKSAPFSGPLSALQPVSVEIAEGSDRLLLHAVLERFHDLGLSTSVGESLGHLVRDRIGRIACCSLTGAAAWRCAAQDGWIGWSDGQPRAGLGLVASQQCFLILDAVRVPHLASRLLSRLCRRLSGDYEARYGHAIQLSEWVVDQSRFSDTCHHAEGWHDAGQTTGRSRNGRPGLSVPRKRVFLRAPRRDAVARLRGHDAGGEAGAGA